MRRLKVRTVRIGHVVLRVGAEFHSNTLVLFQPHSLPQIFRPTERDLKLVGTDAGNAPRNGVRMVGHHGGDPAVNIERKEVEVGAAGRGRYCDICVRQLRWRHLRR